MQAIVIDDGVSNDVFEIDSLVFDLEVTEHCEVQPRIATVNQRSHGTICAAIIRHYNPNVRIGSIKILQSETRVGNIEQLIAALHWCCQHNIKLIHLSAGTILWVDFPKVRESISALHHSGCIIVAAYHNRQVYTLPAAHPYVIGVQCRGDFVNSQCEWEYENGFNPCIVATGKHLLTDKEGTASLTDMMNSYAAPLITAKAARLLDEYSDASLLDIKRLLVPETLVVTNQVVSLDFFHTAVFAGFTKDAVHWSCLPYEAKKMFSATAQINDIATKDTCVILNDENMTEQEFAQICTQFQSEQYAGIAYVGTNAGHRQRLEMCRTFVWSLDAYNKAFFAVTKSQDDIEIPVICIYGDTNIILPFVQAINELFSCDEYYAKSVGQFEYAYLYGFEFISDTIRRKDFLLRIGQKYDCDIILFAMDIGVCGCTGEAFNGADINVVIDGYCSIPSTDDVPCISVDSKNERHCIIAYEQLLRYLTA